MRRQLVPSIVSMTLFTLLLGFGYPLVVTGIGQVAFGGKADGSLVAVDGKAVGSALIGQEFLDDEGNPLPRYFQPRPSSAVGARGESPGYDPTYSSGSNLGPTNPDFLRSVEARVDAYRELNGLGAHVKVPVDAVTASGSGLDPDISVANARLQAGRIASERGLSKRAVLHLIDEHTDGRTLGILGEKAVNVLALNIALDAR